MDSGNIHLVAQNEVPNTASNTVRFGNMYVNTTGEWKDLLSNTCNLGYELECYQNCSQVCVEDCYQYNNECASSSFMILFLIFGFICTMLVFGIVYLFKKKRALERELDRLNYNHANLVASQDKTSAES